MMAVLKETIELIPQHYNIKVDLAALPEDPKVYDALCKADSVLLRRGGCHCRTQYPGSPAPYFASR
jgi:hypothetical protein